MLKKKFRLIFKELYKFLPKKLSLSFQRYGFGIRVPGKTFSLSQIQGSKRHLIPDPESGSAKLFGKSGLIPRELFFTQSRKHFLNCASQKESISVFDCDLTVQTSHQKILFFKFLHEDEDEYF
jgi:hypothetical protein